MKRKTGFIASLFIVFSIVIFSVFPQGKAFAAVEDGTYSITYTVLTADNDSASIANDYFKKPATLTVKDGVMTVQLGMTNASSITWLKTTHNGSLANVSIVSEDKGSDSRVVKFNVDNISDKLVSRMKIDIDDINYHHEYTVRFDFDESSLKATAVAGDTTTDGTKTTDATTNDGTTKTGEDGTTTTTKTTTENPETGDKENIALLAGLLLISAFYFLRKRQARN